MTRKAIYLEAIESIPEPATLRDIQFQASLLFGDEAKATMPSVRASVERFVLLGKVKKLTADGETRYWLASKPINARAYIEHKILMLRGQIRELERQLSRCDEELEANISKTLKEI